MGFTKPKSIPTENTIPVVADNDTETARAAYEQSGARRRGLLSTLLSGSRPAEPRGVNGAGNGNNTLG